MAAELPIGFAMALAMNEPAMKILYPAAFCPSFSFSQFPLPRRIKPRKPCNIRHLRGFSYFRVNSLSRVSSYVLRVVLHL